jgi:DNA invertase Pin-like site-specific DNA recombinase
MGRLAIVYDRASDRQQAGNWSRKDAEDVGLALAQRYGFERAEVRSEVKSGEELLNRPIMRKVLEEIEAGDVGAIIVQNFSRLSRDEDGNPPPGQLLS